MKQSVDTIVIISQTAAGVKFAGLQTRGQVTPLTLFCSLSTFCRLMPRLQQLKVKLGLHIFSYWST